MLSTLKTLIAGSSARTEDKVKDAYAIELIEQNLRLAEGNLGGAKATLASLIQRQRQENRTLKSLNARIETLTTRATEALASEEVALAEEAATAIAELENERHLREETCARLDARIIQLRAGVDAAHRRIVDLKQGAITARAIRRERDAQARLGTNLSGRSAADEAETLIKRVVDQDDPFEQGVILKEIDNSLSQQGIDEKLEARGFGPQTRSTASGVLARLKDKA
ncbi:MAG: PspA/IM30 family protein [Rhodobacteraceae bacterium]|nr:PspA/IM30 family protein [Paracoccaceae bacterium]